MAQEVRDLKQPFAEIFNALDMKTQRKAMRSALLRAGNTVKKEAIAKLASEDIHNGEKVGKSLRIRTYPDKYGLGFMVTAKPRGKKGYYRNSKGREKPVAMWAAEGTKKRTTKSKSKFFVRLKRGRSTGKMPRYNFLPKAEASATSKVEAELFQSFQRNLERAFKKL